MGPIRRMRTQEQRQHAVLGDLHFEYNNRKAPIFFFWDFTLCGKPFEFSFTHQVKQVSFEEFEKMYKRKEKIEKALPYIKTAFLVVCAVAFFVLLITNHYYKFI